MVEEVASSLGLGLPTVPISAREVVRAPVWQRRSAEEEATGDAAASFVHVQGNGTKPESGRETTRENAPAQSVLVLEKHSSPDASKERVASQKTAVDMMIEAMKQMRGSARGVR